jgi:hypothetical protein
MPESLTRKKTPLVPSGVTGFKSEWWPASNRNSGRLQIGTPAGFTSVHPAGLNRNPHIRLTQRFHFAYMDVQTPETPGRLGLRLDV